MSTQNYPGIVNAGMVDDGPSEQRTSKERIMELALAVATANGVLRVELYRGKRYEEIEGDYQDAVRALSTALDEVLL